MRAIERANADVFATRPDDLLGLIALWKATHKIENYTRVVENSIERKLAERNPQHEHVAGLTAERALSGAQQLAAAITLSRKLGLTVPTQTAISEHTEQCIDPRQVLPGWTSAEIVELLGRPLFNPAFYGAVRFHHKTAREYLTAQWLRALLDSRKHRRSVYDMLFAKPYSVENEVVRPSLEPIAGWLAQWDQGVREALQRIDPTVLLGWGDASALPAEVRGHLLQSYAEQYAGRQHTPLSLHIRDIQRLADAKLAPTIRELFAQYAENADLRRLLLKLIQEGRVTACKDLAISLAYDSTAESHMRGYAIGALAVTGTKQDLDELVRFFVEEPGTIDRRIVATLVECLFPFALEAQDLMSLLQKAVAPTDSSSSGLSYFLTSAAKRVQSEADLQTLLSAVEGLLSQKPHIDRFCPVSRKYVWLLEFGATLMAHLLEKNPEARTKPAVLSILRMSQRTDHIREFTGEVRAIASSILEKKPELLRHIFWQEVERVKREGGATPIVRWHDSRLTLHQFSESSFSEYLNDIRGKESIDDQQLALSVVLSIAAGHLDRDRMLALASDAAKGTPILETILEENHRPRQISAQEQEHTEEMRQIDIEIEAQRRKKEHNQKEAVTWLKDHASSLVLGDYAKEGKLLQHIVYLYHEVIGELRHRSRWSIHEWRSLEKDYGSEVARAFRDYCVGYWRLYDPPLRSDPEIEKNSTPTNIIIGLSGLAIESAETNNWGRMLFPMEAQRAIRYALWEMNGFPAWFANLAMDKVADIRAVLMAEIDWEFQQIDKSHVDYYLLSRLRYHQPKLRRMLRSDVIDLLVKSGTQCAPALVAALGAILSVDEPLPSEFRQVALDRAQTTEVVDLKAAWLATLLCIDAFAAIPILKDWIEHAPSAGVADERIIPLLNHLWGEKEESFNTEHTSFLNVDALAAMIRITHASTSLGDESLRHRSGWVSNRDRAVRAIDAALSALSNQSGRRVHAALLELASARLPGLPRDNMLNVAERRAKADAEFESWKATDIVVFQSSAEHAPQSLGDLFDIATHRLDDIKLELEEGDESVASTLQRVDKEPELRRNIAAELRKMSAGFYSVASEEELANSQKTDIRLHHPAVGNRMPIEIKIADKWSARQLSEQLKQQLVGDYMRESPCGIFLLLRRGSATFDDKKSWENPDSGEVMSFIELLNWLNREANAIQWNNEGINLRVIGIDLTRRRL